MKWLLILIPIILIILLFLPVTFNIVYIFNNGYDKFKVSTSYLFGLFKPELQPFKKDKNKKSNKNINRFKPIIEYLEYKELIDYIWDKIVVEKINWKTTIGFVDSFYLSLIYGSIWWLKSILLSMLMSCKKIEESNIDVVPVFNKNQLDIKFNCIIKIRLVYIINIWIWFLKLYRGGEKNDRSSNRRFNENYNE